MVIVMPAFAGGEQRDKAEIRSGVVEILLPEGMIGAVDHGIQENVNAGLNDEGDAAPQRAQEEHEDADAEQDADEAESEEVTVKPIVANIRRECRQRLRIFCFAIVVIDVSKKDAPQAFENRTMRIAFDVGVAMMLAMDGNPFLGVNSGPKPELHAHRKRHHRMQVDATMGQSAMQVNAGGKCGKLDNDNNSENGV